MIAGEVGLGFASGVFDFIIGAIRDARCPMGDWRLPPEGTCWVEETGWRTIGRAVILDLCPARAAAAAPGSTH